MLKSKLTHVLLACLLLTATNISHGQSKATFTFANSFTTSAGVFTQDGVLIKTLWSNVKYAAGTYTQTWDGTDDDNHLVSGGNYSVRVLANNVKYQWQGVIGNTSSALSGTTVNHAFQGMYGMAFAGTNAYYCTNYNEQGQPILTFNTKAPQAKTSLLTNGVPLLLLLQTAITFIGMPLMQTTRQKHLCMPLKLATTAR